MSQSDTPNEVRSSDGLGLAPERKVFEHWYVTHVFDLQRAPIGSRDFVLQWEAWQAAAVSECERAARVCDDEARVRSEAGDKHPEESESRGRCYAAARAATNCAKGVRSGEEV